MRKAILGLDRFGLSAVQFARLPHRKAKIYIHLNSWSVTPDVVACPPDQRLSYLGQRWDRWHEQLKKRFPHLRFKPDSIITLPSSFHAQVTSSEIKQLLKLPSVRSVYIDRLQGFSPAPKKRGLTLYCIRARVALQIEDQRAGLQSVEDRFVVIPAKSPKDANKRLIEEWRQYSTPYINSDGCLVRWQMEEVIDIYETFDTEIQPTGTEVYSKLSYRRMQGRPAWTPRKHKHPTKKRG